MPWEAATAADARRSLADLFVAPEEPIPVGAVQERDVPIDGTRVRTRIFTPEGEGTFPILLWFHGGGWVVGSLEESDTVCRSLCARTGAIVVCPDYRMAPEHRFPVAVEDCYALTAWAAEAGPSFGGDPSRIAVAGDSAGGNLAAAVALMARDRSGPRLVFQALVYPVLGMPDDGRPSYDAFAEGLFLTRHGMEWFAEQYLGGPVDARNPYLVPLRAEDLAGLPPALILTAEYDPLRDEGEEYARRLEADGTPCTLSRYAGMIHAFFVLPDQFDDAVRAHEQVAGALREAFAAPARVTA
ncbi:MAG TPA: alpha/beta hydrolase [Gaiellaceae bacterium]|jgi:acetyl esterase|nr:alpha/beta hydrolase [Gaiellaceae bacterium]